MAVTGGRYYLICNYDKYDDISNYRIDRIQDIKILDTPVKPFSKTKGKKYGLKLSEHISEHIYMFSSEIIQVRFRAKRYIINDVIDYFGSNIKIFDVTDTDCTVRVRVSEEDMFKWAVQFSDHAVVLEPVSLRERVITALKNALNNYEEV